MLKFVILTSILLYVGTAIELTFELPDNANQCFYEDLKKDVDTAFEFQVVTGGHYDVDLIIEDPNGKVLYKDTKKQYDSINFKAEVEGTYKACFSNEFSTFSHKIVYMDWQFGDQNALHAAVTQGAHAMTQLENYAVAIGDKLRTIDDYQTHHRLREATGRKRAEELNERVMIWSLGQSAVVVFIGIGQVFLLKSFFNDKRTRY
uniref:GOLD domain-containing protein n=1 Tax=Caenorhabditis tropicalis TaxID=1561998 RepID=A0A1I7TD07_9PELO